MLFRSTYKFNSYRLAYLYELVSSPSFLLRGGFVGKIREAKVAVRGSGLNSSYDNVGFVPLLNLGFNLRLAKRMDFRFDLDGAAAKQGRAFDGSAELFYRADDRGSGISGGIRILEGGADNSKVNTFALLDYAFLAITVGFGN